MGANHHRRDFLRTAAGTGAALGLSNLGFLSQLGPVSAAEAKLDPNKVRYGDDIEPLVRLLEDTPRERVIEEVAARVKKGLDIQATPRGDSTGWRPRYSTAAGRFQVPRRLGCELGQPGEPGLARRASLAADLLGDRRVQIVAGPEHQGGKLDDAGGR